MSSFTHSKKRSVFKDHGVLSFDYVPEELPHRDKQLQRLFTLFSPILESNISQNAFLTGNVGTGKTVISKRFCADFQDLARKSKKNIQYVFVNCRQRNSEQAAMLRILGHFQPHFPDRGFSITEMLNSLRKNLVKENAHLIVVLDEVDVLLKKAGSDLIYHFSRFNEEGIDGKQQLSLILISQKNIYEMLDPAVISTFKRGNIIKFDKYKRDELIAILEQRVLLAFHPEAVDMEIIDLISDIASEWGDARYGIEILDSAGMLADEANDHIVNAEHVRRARAETNPTDIWEKLTPLDTHKKILLLAIARSLKKDTYATTGKVEKIYNLVCEEFDEKARAHTQLWKYLKELDSLGMIEARKSSRGVTGTTTLISIPDVPAEALEEKLLGMVRPGKRSK